MSLDVMPLSNVFSTSAELHVPPPAGLTRGQRQSVQNLALVGHCP